MKKQTLATLVGAAVLALSSTLATSAVAAPSQPLSDVQPVAHRVSSTPNSGAKTSPLVTAKTGASGGHFSLGGASTDSVIGRDGRTRVTTTTTAPSRQIVQIEFNGGYICSGSMISADTVLTAGHCVHAGGTGSTNDFSWGITVAPGRNALSDPYGTCGATDVFTDQRWIDSANTNADWGVIKLDCTVGNTTGWFSYRATTASLNGTAATVRGYPGDKPFGTMWTMSGTIAQTGAEKIYYAMDTYGGQSGCPVYDSSNRIIAIHTNGGRQYNSGTKITPTLASYLNSVK